jgi:hypothetical protein
VQPGAASSVDGRGRPAVAAIWAPEEGGDLEDGDRQVGPPALDDDDGGDGKHCGQSHDGDGEGESQGRPGHLRFTLTLSTPRTAAR